MSNDEGFWLPCESESCDETWMRIVNGRRYCEKHAPRSAEPEHIEVAPGQCLLCYRSLTYCDCAQPQVAPGQQDGGGIIPRSLAACFRSGLKAGRDESKRKITELEAAITLALEQLEGIQMLAEAAHLSGDEGVPPKLLITRVRAALAPSQPGKET